MCGLQKFRHLASCNGPEETCAGRFRAEEAVGILLEFPLEHLITRFWALIHEAPIETSAPRGKIREEGLWGSTATARRYLATTPDGSAFMITIGSYDTRRLEDTAARLDHGLNLAIDKMVASTGARLIKSDFSDAHVDMLSARQTNGTIQIPASSSVQRFSIRIAVYQNKMYLLSAIGNERALQGAAVESFFDSFHLK